MPRIARIVIADYPHHIIQRGHNRQVVFAGDEDYLYYLENLKEWKKTFKCKVYAYCLMTNHYLIVSPSKKAENLALLMKRVSGRQTRYVNKIERRSGTLWEGRYKSSLISAHPQIEFLGKRALVGFQSRNEQFFVRSRKSRDCAEAYFSTSHKQSRRLTQRLRKRAVSGWKLAINIKQA